WEFSLPATLQNFFWLECLVSGTAFRIEEPKKLLKRVGICRVPKESTLALHLDESLVPQLVQVMGKSRIGNSKLFLNLSNDEAVRMRRQQELHDAEPRLHAHG